MAPRAWWWALAAAWFASAVGGDVELLAVVLTVPAHTANRDAIRRGWGKPSSFDVLLWFVVSSRDPGFEAAAFSAERSARGDVVVCDVASGFDRIITKVSCALAKATASVAFDFVIKTDDDATLCLGQIIKDLRGVSPRDAAVYAGRNVKFRRPLPEGKPLRTNLGLERDPPHFGGHLCGNQIFNPTSMFEYSNVLTRVLPLCFENSMRAIDPSKNQPNRLRFDRAREF